MPRCLVVVRIPRSKTNKRGARERTRRPLDTFLAKFFCKSTSQFMVILEVDERQQKNMLVSSRHVACVKIKKSALLDPLPIPPLLPLLPTWPPSKAFSPPFHLKCLPHMSSLLPRAITPFPPTMASSAATTRSARKLARAPLVWSLRVRICLFVLDIAPFVVVCRGRPAGNVHVRSLVRAFRPAVHWLAHSNLLNLKLMFFQ